jgi:hypothetical protein
MAGTRRGCVSNPWYVFLFYQCFYSSNICIAHRFFLLSGLPPRHKKVPNASNYRHNDTSKHHSNGSTATNLATNHNDGGARDTSRAPWYVIYFSFIYTNLFFFSFMFLLPTQTGKQQMTSERRNIVGGARTNAASMLADVIHVHLLLYCALKK